MIHMPLRYEKKFFDLNFCFWFEAHATPFLRNLKFSFSLWWEVRHMPHPCKTTFDILNLCYEACASPSLRNLNFFLSLCLEVRHMPHPYETKLYVLNLFSWGEAHASPSLRILAFSLSLCLEVRHTPHS